MSHKYSNGHSHKHIFVNQNIITLFLCFHFKISFCHHYQCLFFFPTALHLSPGNYMSKDGTTVQMAQRAIMEISMKEIELYVFVNLPEEYLLQFGCFAITGADKMNTVKARIFGELRHRLLSLLPIPTMPDWTLWLLRGHYRLLKPIQSAFKHHTFRCRWMLHFWKYRDYQRLSKLRKNE